MTVTIAALRAAGLSAEQIVRVLETAENEKLLHRREQNRINKQNQRERHQIRADVDDIDDRADTNSPPSASPPSMVSPITPSLTPSSSPSPDDTSRARASVTTLNRGSRLAEDWQPNADDLKQAREIGLQLYEIDNEILKFRDYWKARADKGAVKRDWSATWRNWCRKVIENGKPNGAHSNGHGRQLQDDRLSVGKAAERLAEQPGLDIPPRPTLVPGSSPPDRRLLPKG